MPSRQQWKLLAKDAINQGTQVGIIAVDGKLYFMTPASTWKARRVAHNPHVTLVLCTFGGKALRAPARVARTF
jgi:Pyridoxamine 5'-phosphate oxidase